MTLMIFRNLFAIAMTLTLVATEALAADKLIILSPHRSSIKDEYLPAFKDHYKATYKTDVEVEWLDQGGTSDDVRFLRAKFEKNPQTSGIDIFWGGGTATFMELNTDKLLSAYDIPADLKKEIPDSVAGIPLYDKSKTWYASAMSSFGVFYNKKIMKMDGLPEPTKWDDLANPKFKNQLSLTDPRRSGTANTMNNIVMQALGWDQGWELLTKIAGNTRHFTHSSSDPIKAVVSGDAAASMVIDFYAVAKVDDLGKDNLGFNVPVTQTVIDPDPIAIIKGAPNRTTAERFIDFVLSAEGQKLLILPKGAKGGPKLASLGRMAVNTRAYAETKGQRNSDFNPFEQKGEYLKLDLAKATKMQRTFNDLIGAIHVDTHGDLKAAWDAILKRGAKPAEIAELAKPPVTEAELLQMADKWEDDVFRNKTINAWVEYAKSKYKKLTSNS
jgi:ABC-type Fe3+ transport system substrate-binding protein